MSGGAELAEAILDGLNRRDLAAVARCYTADAVVLPDGWHQEVDLPTWHGAFGLVLTSFPDLALTAGHVVAGDGVVILEARLTGTNSGPFHLGDVDRLVLGTDAERLPPTGRTMDIRGTVVLETSAGRVASERHYWRLFDTLIQLGLVGVASPVRA